MILSSTATIWYRRSHIRYISTRPTTGKTAVIVKYGGPASVTDLLPSGFPLDARPGPDSVRIRVHAASINPLDLMMRQGYGRSIFERLRRDRFPFCLGLDCAGTVHSVGSLVQDFAEGDRVIGINSPVCHTGYGTWCEYIDLPVSLVGKIADHLDDFSAAAIPFAAMTAASSIPSGNIHRAIIIGASGGVGLFSLQMLKQRNVYVVAVASEANSSICYSYGADLFVDYSKETIGSKVEEGSVDFVLNASSSDAESSLIEPYLRCLRTGGTYKSLSSPFIRMCDSYGNFLAGASSAAMELAKTRIQYKRDRKLNFDWSFFNPCAAIWKQIVESSSNGELKAHVSKVFPLDEIVAAQEYMENAHAPGKVVISIGTELNDDR